VANYVRSDENLRGPQEERLEFVACFIGFDWCGCWGKRREDASKKSGQHRERFAHHKQGIKDAWVVKRYGVRLLPELFAHLNPMPFDAAAQMEKDLAEDLRRAGYTVTGGH
jgi:hypothetical protein